MNRRDLFKRALGIAGLGTLVKAKSVSAEPLTATEATIIQRREDWERHWRTHKPPTFANYGRMEVVLVNATGRALVRRDVVFLGEDFISVSCAPGGLGCICLADVEPGAEGHFLIPAGGETVALDVLPNPCTNWIRLSAPEMPWLTGGTPIRDSFLAPKEPT